MHIYFVCVFLLPFFFLIFLFRIPKRQAKLIKHTYVIDGITSIATTQRGYDKYSICCHNISTVCVLC